VVVGERDTVNAEPGERVNRPRRRTEVEHTAGHWFAARGDAALEVEHEEIGDANDLDEFRALRTNGGCSRSAKARRVHKLGRAAEMEDSQEDRVA
jgi:hypothetical protein